MEKVYEKSGGQINLDQFPNNISELTDYLQNNPDNIEVQKFNQVMEKTVKTQILNPDVIEKLTDGKAKTLEEFGQSEEAQKTLDEKTGSPRLKRVLLALLAAGTIAGGLLGMAAAIAHHETGCYQFQVQAGHQQKVNIGEDACNCNPSSCPTIVQSGYCPCQASVPGCTPLKGMKCDYPYVYKWHHVSLWQGLANIPAAAGDAIGGLVNKGFDFGIDKFTKFLKKLLGPLYQIIVAILAGLILFWVARKLFSRGGGDNGDGGGGGDSSKK